MIGTTPQMQMMPQAVTSMPQRPAVAPFLWYEAGVLWAGQGPAAKLLPIGFDNQAAFQNCMLANVSNPSFPTLHGAYAASFQVTNFAYSGGQYCLVAVAPSMASYIQTFCGQNGIRAITSSAGSGYCSPVSQSTNVAALLGPPVGPYTPVYPASLLNSVSALSPGGQATVTPQFILCTGSPAGQPATLAGCMFTFSPSSQGLL